MEKDLKNLLIDELHDTLSSEEQITEALPDLVKAAESPDLKAAFEAHLKETKGQIVRLKNIFKLLKVEKKEKLCKATKGLIQECKEVLKEYKTKSPVRDSAIISKAQRIEHYEISSYGTMHTFAKELGLSAVASLLQETLDEEGNADKKLTKIAKGGLLSSGVNHKALISENEKSSSSTKRSGSTKSPTRRKTASSDDSSVTQKIGSALQQGAKKIASLSHQGAKKIASLSHSVTKKASTTSRTGAKKTTASSNGAKKPASASRFGAKKTTSSSNGAKKPASTSRYGTKKTATASHFGAKKTATASHFGAKKPTGPKTRQVAKKASPKNLRVAHKSAGHKSSKGAFSKR